SDIASAQSPLGGGQITNAAVIPNLRVASPEAGRPVGIPVVVERTTDAPSVRQLEALRGTTTEATRVDGVSYGTESDALVTARNSGAAEHQELRRSAGGRDHRLGGALGEGGVDLEVVARTGRNVLDLQRSHHRTAPLVFGVTADLREVVRSTTSRCQHVVGSVHVVRQTANLEQTPGLVDADVADDVRSVDAAVGLRRHTASGSRETNRNVTDNGAVVHGRFIQTDGARHAVAELSGVLDVVDAGYVVRTADQVRVVVARIAVPGRRKGRNRLTEGEAGELQEDLVNCDVGIAGA